MAIESNGKVVETKFVDKPADVANEKEESKMKKFWNNHKKGIIAAALGLGGVVALAMIGKRKMGEEYEDNSQYEPEEEVETNHEE